MDAVVLVAIGILTVIFIGSLFALIIVCRHKYCRPLNFLTQQFNDKRPEKYLISNEDCADLELDDVRLHPNIEKILANEQWVDDATGLIPHCLAILKKCHNLTERLVPMMMTYVSQNSQQELGKIIEAAKKTIPRVDDVVRAMYPPLDPRLLEARCIALFLSVNHLVLVTRLVCHIQTPINWIDIALSDIEENLQVLREAGLAQELSSSKQTNGNLEWFNVSTKDRFTVENSRNILNFKGIFSRLFGIF